MTAVLDQQIPNLMYSVVKWFETVQYTARGSTGTLKDHFGGLQVIAGYPDDLVELNAPTLAISGPSSSSEGGEYYGSPGQRPTENMYLVGFHGFVLGQASGPASHLYRDQLRNDVVMLLRAVASDEGIPLYDAVTGAAITDPTTGQQSVDVDGVSSRLVPANALEVDAEKWKFSGDFQVAYE